MTTGRAILFLAVVAAVGAGPLAAYSRAPEAVRKAEPGPAATDASNGADFTDAQIARHGAYRRPAYLAIGLYAVVEVVALLVLARFLMPRVARLAEGLPGGWPVAALVAAAVVVVTLTLVALPLSFVRGYAMDQAWGLSTQNVWGWLGDKGRGLLVAVVTTGVAAVAFFALVRWVPRTWWLWGWIVFTLLTIAFTFLWPVVVAPLFNRFTPVADADLRARVVALSERAGVDVDDVLVADASRRTTAENAYVAGIGSSKRMVLYDNLLSNEDQDEVAFVVAHELGHEVEHHIWRGVGMASAGLLVAFAVLAWLSSRSGVWSWAGASGISDVRALPLLLLFATGAGLVSLPLQNAVSRSFERRADAIALELTGQPGPAVEVFRRLAFANISDLDPPRAAVWGLFTHPPVRERIETALSVAGNPQTP